MNVYVCIYLYTQCIKEGNATICDVTGLSLKYTVLGNSDMERQILYESTSMEFKKEKKKPATTNEWNQNKDGC